MDKFIIMLLLKILSVEDYMAAQRVIDLIDSYKGSPQFLMSTIQAIVRPLPDKVWEESKYDENGDLLVVMFPNDGPRTICD